MRFTDKEKNILQDALELYSTGEIKGREICKISGFELTRIASKVKALPLLHEEDFLCEDKILW